jgi:hypothetical protein
MILMYYINFSIKKYFYFQVFLPHLHAKPNQKRRHIHVLYTVKDYACKSRQERLLPSLPHFLIEVLAMSLPPVFFKD